MSRNCVYEPKGRAKEYAGLALNLFDSCPHGCIYCWAPTILHKDRAAFHGEVRARVSLEDIEKSAVKFQGDKRPVLLSFACDPYPPESSFALNEDRLFTREAIEILHLHGLHVTILTKGGLRSTRDFDLLGPGDAYATTLTFLGMSQSREWEPGAAWPLDRIRALQEAHRRGIPTWVSLEPVIDAVASLELIRETHKVVGHYKLGKLNYHPLAKSIDWKRYFADASCLLGKLNKPYYVKADLAKYAGRPEGYWVGVRC